MLSLEGQKLKMTHREGRERHISHPCSKPSVGLLDGMFNINLNLITIAKRPISKPTGHHHQGEPGSIDVFSEKSSDVLSMKQVEDFKAAFLALSGLE